MRSPFAALALILATSLAQAQPSTNAVTELTTGDTLVGLGRRTGVSMGGLFYFPWCDALGCELWRTDGTTAGTALVRDIEAGAGSSSPSGLTVIGSTLYFAAFDSANGRELWKTDGTSAGTVLVRNIASGATSSSPTGLVALGSTLIFAAYESSSFGVELFRSTGTSAGTVRVSDIYSGGTSSFPEELTAVGGFVYFSAEHPVYGRELWRTDGTLAGTVIVSDFVPGIGWSDPHHLTAFGSALILVAHDTAVGNELFRTDGLSSSLVKDIYPGTGSSDPSEITVIGTTLYMSAKEPGTGIEPWRSDGTTLGTVRLKDIRGGGTGSSPRSFTSSLGLVFFSADDGSSGAELWKTDGTEGGTALVRDLWSGAGPSSPSFLDPIPYGVVFSARGADGSGMYRSNGTAEGTTFISQTATSTFGEVDQTMAYGTGLLVSSFTPTGAFNRLSLLSDKTLLGRAQTVWQSYFAVNSLETPYVGDFNGDNKTDLITFTRQNPNAIGDVYVSLSNGSTFGPSAKWHDFFAITTDETVVIGDFDGDGKDDIATWLGKTSRQVYVARSTGSGMTPETPWVNSIGSASTDIPAAGDVNGDGKDDLVMFVRGEGKVYVALSDGTKFATPAVWHPFFAVSTYERPRVADVNGDGKADIVTFATDSPTAFGDVYVALSNGSSFRAADGSQNSDKWHDFFAIRPSEEIRIGDLNGDSKADFFTFLPPPFGQCYTVLSQGTSMAANVLWREDVTPLSTDRPFVGDVNGDGKADIIIFAQNEGKVYVSLAP